jgi:hypothetical protein
MARQRDVVRSEAAFLSAALDGGHGGKAIP